MLELPVEIISATRDISIAAKSNIRDQVANGIREATGIGRKLG